MGIKVPVQVEMDDGRSLKAIVDQRDLAAAEATELPDGMHLRVRFLAYSALKRTKQYAGSWEEFNSLDCVEAIDGDSEESGDAETGLDPGQKAATVTS